jgi:aryl-alcohol dehydrogenase-like predicted oxidoreductase
LANGKLARDGGPLDTVARQVGATVSQVSLAWLLRRSAVMLPIPGTSSVEHLEENWAAGEVSLSDSQYDQLVDARKPVRRWALGG